MEEASAGGQGVAERNARGLLVAGVADADGVDESAAGADGGAQRDLADGEDWRGGDGSRRPVTQRRRPPPKPVQASLAIVLAPAGTGLTTWTAKVRSALAPAPAREPTCRLQVEPAAGDEQVQPGELAAAAKVVCAGTRSVSTTEAAARLPVFWTVIE